MDVEFTVDGLGGSLDDALARPRSRALVPFVAK